MKKIVLFLVLYIIALQSHAQVSWQTLPTFPGPGRHHSVAFSHGGKAYVVTGQGSTQLKDFWEFDTLTGVWTQLPDYPGPARSYGVGCVVADTAYIGLGYAGTTDMTDWWAYDFSTSTWTQKATNPMPPRRHPTGITLNGKIYAGMGDNSNGVQFRDWWEYDPTTDSWNQKSNYPGLKMHHPVSAADDSLIYLSEGHLIEGTTNTGSIGFYSYDPINDNWDTLANMPGPGVVAGASFYLPNGKVYSGNGITEPVETWHKQFYEYDVATGVWDTISNYPGVGNFGPSYFTIGNYGYVVTGSTQTSGTGEFYRLGPLLSLDGGISAISTGTACGTVVPTVTLKNYGLTTITSCTINYKIDNNTILTQAWTGSLSSNSITTITLPAQSVTGVGTHTVTCYSSVPNTIADPNSANDQCVITFLNFSSVSLNTPVTQGFSSIIFPPSGWFVGNSDGATTWARRSNAGGFGNSTNSAFIHFFAYTGVGEVDYLYSPPIDFSTLSGNAGMTFSVAHARYDNTFCDELDVQVSTDCGGTWTTLYAKSCAQLATTSNTTNAFTPTATQWRSDTVDLTSYVGMNGVMIRFKSINGNGNDLFIDDINIGAFVGIHENRNGFDFSLYPNPSNDFITIQGHSTSGKLEYNISNAIGEKVMIGDFSARGDYNATLDLSELSNGLYFITIIDDQSSVTKKIIKK